MKQGERGCQIYQDAEHTEIPAFKVDEVDPTGAGDAFCAAFTVALLEGKSPVEAGRFANAVGALAVGKKGPMEGVPTRADVTRFLDGAPEIRPLTS